MPKKNWLEWIVFAVSLGLILATVAILVHEQWSLTSRPADPRIEVGKAEWRNSYFAVPVTMRNEGDKTAKNLQLEVKLELETGGHETSNVTIDYLPRRATRHAWVTFQQDPNKGRVVARVLGYELP